MKALMRGTGSSEGPKRGHMGHPDGSSQVVAESVLIYGGGFAAMENLVRVMGRSFEVLLHKIAVSLAALGTEQPFRDGCCLFRILAVWFVRRPVLPL